MFNVPLWPEQASSFAWQVDAITIWITAVGALLFLGVAFFLVYFGVKYRRGNAALRINPPHGNLAIELLWIAGPLFLALITWLAGTFVYLNMSRPPIGAIEVTVIGKQWMWYTQHPTGQREINELHVPVGRPVKVTLASQDVIHSFFVPAFRIKQDALPGRYTVTWFEATKPGTYRMHCTEYCGTQHADMGGRVIALDSADYEAWLAGARREGPITGSIDGGEESDLAAQLDAAAASGQVEGGQAANAPTDGETMANAGEALFRTKGCTGCHGANSTQNAPKLAGVYGQPHQLEGGGTVVADDNYIRESILQPNAKIVAGYPAIMPSYQGNVTELELLQLIAYIRSLADQTNTSNSPATTAVPGVQNQDNGTANPGATPGSQ